MLKSIVRALPLFGGLILTSAIGLAENKSAAPKHIAEEIIFAPQEGAANEDKEIRRWQERAAASDAKAETYERLAWAFIAKARRTLDAGYYKLAENTADTMDAKFGASAESRLLRGHIFHNLHRFAESEKIARALVTERGAPADLALLSDALVEQGRLGEAVEVLQRLVNLKPGAEAYTRIAHLRWIKGDLPGAMAAMETAFRATSVRDAESYAWILSRLSGFYLQAGDAPRALLTAESALKHGGDYPPALLAQGRALMASGRTNDAVTALQAAATLNPLPEYQWWLADALRAADRGTEAQKIESDLKRRGAVSDPRTYALFLATRGEDAALAVRLAREELTQRGDVFTHDALAWALKAQGELAAADLEMHAALAEHSKDARLLLHAGEIAHALGRTEEAQARFAEARTIAGSLTPSERALLERHEPKPAPALVQAR